MSFDPESVAELLETSCQMCVDRRGGDVEKRRNLSTVVAIAVNQHDDQTLTFGEGSQGSGETWLEIGPPFGLDWLESGGEAAASASASPYAVPIPGRIGP